MLYQSKSSREPSTEGTLFSKTLPASSKCLCPSYPRPLESWNKIKYSFPIFSTPQPIRITSVLYPTLKKHYDPQTCPPTESETSNAVTRNKAPIPTTSSISKGTPPERCLPSLLQRIRRDRRLQSPGTMHCDRLRWQPLLQHQTHARTHPGFRTRSGWHAQCKPRYLAALEWLTYMNREPDVANRHASNLGEHVIFHGDKNSHVDGYDERTPNVYELNGCFWHGCPKCIPDRDKTVTRSAKPPNSEKTPYSPRATASLSCGNANGNKSSKRTIACVNSSIPSNSSPG